MKKIKCVLYKQDTVLFCDSLSEAAKVANTSAQNISQAIQQDRRKCMGWNLMDMNLVADFLKKYGELPLTPRLRVNGLLTPNKTELNYYAYQAEKGAKA